MPMDDHAHRYGAAHKRQRKFYADAMAAGATYACTRCGLPVDKRTTQWHLGHAEAGGPRDWTGPEHASCNAAVNAAPVTGRERPPRPAVGACGSTRPPSACETNWGDDPDWIEDGRPRCWEQPLAPLPPIHKQCLDGCPWIAHQQALGRP